MTPATTRMKQTAQMIGEEASWDICARQPGMRIEHSNALRQFGEPHPVLRQRHRGNLDPRDLTGPAEFLDLARQSGELGALTHHGDTTHNCAVDGDTAHAETYVQFLSLSPDRSTVRILAGRSIDRLNGEMEPGA